MSPIQFTFHTSEIANLRAHTTCLVTGSVAANIIAFVGIAAV